MKEIAFIQIGLCLILSCSRTPSQKIEDNRSKSRISFYHEFFYMPIDSAGQLKKGENHDPFYNSSHKESFNADGNSLEDVWFKGKTENRKTSYGYDTTGKLILEKYLTEQALSRTTEYKWDTKGHKVEERTYHPDETKNTKNVFLNDKHGNCVENTWTKYDGTLYAKVKSRFDEQNNLIEQRHYKSSGELDRAFVIKYDNSGNRIEEESYNEEDQLVYRRLYKYDKSDKKTEEITFLEPNHQLDYSARYSYDDQGNTIKESFSGSSNYSMEFKYEYDQNNNWVKKVEYRNNQPELIVERKISYNIP